MTFTLQNFAVENYFKSSENSSSEAHISLLTVFIGIDVVTLRRAMEIPYTNQTVHVHGYIWQRVKRSQIVTVFLASCNDRLLYQQVTNIKYN